MLDNQRTRRPHSNSKWAPTREEFQRMAIKHDTLLRMAKEHADDPGSILSALYHDIIEKYCNLRGELRELRQKNAELKRNNALLKQVLEKRSDNLGELEKW